MVLVIMRQRPMDNVQVTGRCVTNADRSPNIKYVCIQISLINISFDFWFLAFVNLVVIQELLK